MVIKIIISRLELLFLTLISFAVVFSRFLIDRILVSFYYVDVHSYFSIAIGISKDLTIPMARGFPFLYLWGNFIKISAPVMNAFDATKLLLIIINLFLAWAIYAGYKSIAGKTVAFFATVFSVFTVNFVFYSMVPYLEMFAFLTAWVSLSLLFKYYQNQKLLYLLGSFLFVIISGFTRTEMFLVIGVPIFAVVVLRNFLSGKRRDKIFGVILLSLVGLFAVVFYSYFFGYYYSTTRFDPITKFMMGVRWDVFLNIFNSVFAVAQNFVLDTIFKGFFIFGLGFTVASSLLQLRKKSKDGLPKKVCHWFRELFTAPKKCVLTTYLLIIVAEFAYLIAFGYSYSITGNTVTIMVTPLSLRTIIGAQILLVPLFFYFLFKIFSQNQIISKLNLKINLLKKRKFTSRINLSVIVSVLLLIIFLPNMWAVAISSINTTVSVMNTYKETANWLSTELSPGQKTLLPSAQIFYNHVPALQNESSGYSAIWQAAGVSVTASTTSDDYLRVRRALISYIYDNPNLRFMVVDWMDPIAQVYMLKVNDELVILLIPVHTEAYTNPLTGYTTKITVYEVNRSIQNFAFLTFSNATQQNSITSREFGNCTGSYELDDGLIVSVSNATTDSIYRLYLPLNVTNDKFNNAYNFAVSCEYNASINPKVAIQLTLYLDKNGDGVFDYDHDSVSSLSLSSTFKVATDSYLTFNYLYNITGVPIQAALGVRANNNIGNFNITIKNLNFFIFEG